VIGEAVSVFGDQVWYVALSWAAVRLASPGVAGLVLAVSSIPRLLLLVLGGPLADRYDARRLMVFSDALRSVVMLASAAIALWSPNLGLLIVVCVVFGVVDAVFLPAAGSMRARLLRTEQLSDGAALRELSTRAALSLGAPLGGVLVAIGGLPLACAVNAVTFVGSLLAIRTLRPRPVERTEGPDREPYGTALRDGLRHLARHRVLRPLLLVSLLINVGFVGPMNIGLALLSGERGWGPAGIGLMLAGFGCGAAAAAAVMVKVRIRRRLGVGIALGALGEAAGIIGAAIAPNLTLAVAATTAVGLLGGPIGILCNALVQAQTTDGYRGRVSSVQSLLSLGVTPLAMTVAGVAAGYFGVTASFLGGAALEATAAVTCLLLPQLRQATIATS
jgi:MFS family permease